MECASEYSFQIINDELEKAYQELKNVILTSTEPQWFVADF